MEDKVPLSIIYLGRKGGGAKTALQISQELRYSKVFAVSSICLRQDNEILDQFDQSKVTILFDELISTKTVLKSIGYFFLPSRLLSVLQLEPSGFCLVPMISPLGLIIEGILKFKGVKIIRLLHDFEKHPGDNWPPNVLIRRIVKRSNFLIALSSDVASKIRELNPKIKVAIYPHPPFKFSQLDLDMQISTRYILFIGRIRKYKGIENLVAAFTNLAIKDTDLVIAGEGKLRITSTSNIKVINRWIQEKEISSLIKNAEIVVFPYLEASQSGILPYCVSMNKKVVVTPLPGLIEQTLLYKNAFITTGFEVDNLSYTINAAIQTKAIVENSELKAFKNIETCLLESGLFSKQ